MNIQPDLDQVIGQWLRESAPATPPAQLHGDLLERVRRARQPSRRWTPIPERWTWSPGRWLRALAFALTLALVVLAVAVWSLLPVAAPTVPTTSSSPTPGVSSIPTASARATDPTASPSTGASVTAPPQASEAPVSGDRQTSRVFKLPFSYVIPDGSPLVASRLGPRPDQFRWVDGTHLPLGWQTEDEANAATITIAAPSLPWVHACDGGARTPISASPREFVADLNGVGGLTVGGPTDTAWSGMPALSADVDAGGAGGVCSTHLHVHGPIAGLADDQTVPIVPSRITVAALDGQLLVVTIAAPTSAGLAAFLPDAQEFLGTIRFADAGPGASPAPTTTTRPSGEPFPVITTTVFDQPFRYVLSRDSGLQLAADPPHWDEIAWVVGDNRPSDPSNEDYGGQLPEAGNQRGIIVAIPSYPWTHACPGGARETIGTTPDQLLADLGTLAGVEMTTPETIAFHGLDALQVDVAGGECAFDLHIHGPMTGPLGSAVLFLPSRLIVAEREGRLFLVDIWARSQEDLVGFLPTANPLVNSIHFLP